MEAKRRAILHFGIFFLGLWVGAGTAQAKESRIKVADGVQVVVADAENGKREILVKSPLTNDEWTVLGVVDSADLKGAFRFEKPNVYCLPAVVNGNVDITILVLETGQYAWVPVRGADNDFDLQWATRFYGNEAFVVSSVKTEKYQGTFLSKLSNVSTVTLDHRSHDITSSEAYFVHLFEDGTLWLPSSGAYFDVDQFDTKATKKADGKLLQAATTEDIERFRAMHERSGSTEAFGSSFVFEPGKDATVMWHPLWERTGSGLRAADKDGGMEQYLNNLGQFLWVMDKEPKNKDAAQAAFRLFAGEEAIRKELSLAESIPLEVEHYRAFVKKKRSEWKKVQEGKMPRPPEPRDAWVTRQPFWRILQAEETAPEKFDRLAGALSQKDPVGKEIAQAAARMLLGGETGVHDHAGIDRAEPLSDEDYVKAARARSHFSRVVLARMALEPWLAERSASKEYWWVSLAQIIQLRPTPEMTEAAIEIVERELGSPQEVAKLLGKTEPLVASDYMRAARMMSRNHIPENIFTFCNRVTRLLDEQPPHPTLN